MRIRRRPQALIPSPMYQASGPSAAPQPPPPGNQQHWISRPSQPQGQGRCSQIYDDPISFSHRQGDNVVGRSDNSPGRGAGCVKRQAGAADCHGSLENGDHDGCDQWALINVGEEGLANGAFEAMPLASMSPLMVKEGSKTDSPKRRRRPAMLLEGSRCSRVNGRGWRCSQPTLIGYSLCEHHLGKGRQSRAKSGSGGRNAGASKLGRTEPSGKKSVALLALAAAVADGNQPAAHLAAGFS